MSGVKFVFCEGKDDVAVVKGLAGSMGLSDLRIEPIDGKNRLRDFLASAKTRPEFSRNEVAAFGVIRDADNDGAAAFQSVRDALSANGFKAPDKNASFVANGIRIGVLIVGPNDGKGMLEDLCLNSVSDRPEFPCVEDYFQCIAQKSNRRDFSPKAKVRVWMASHEDFSLYVGKAAEKGYWPWESPAFDPLREFLKQL